MGVGVAQRPAGEARVAEASHGALDYLHPVVGRVEHALRVVVGVDDEGVPDSQRDDLAGRADPGAAVGVVGLPPGLGGAAAAVVGGARVARGVVGVVVVVEEVPSGDVVDVAVGVVVDGVAEDRDQVRGVERPVGFVVARGGRDPRVAGEVRDVEGPVAVGVVGGREARARPAGVEARRTIDQRSRQLVLVERDLGAQLRPVPADPGVEDRHLDVRIPDGRARAELPEVLPGAIGRNAGDLAQRIAQRGRVLSHLARRCRRRVVERGVLGALGREAEALELLIEDVAAGLTLRIVRLAMVEVGIVRGVQPDALVGVGPGEHGERDRREKERDDDRRDDGRPPRRTPRPLGATHCSSEPSASRALA